MKKVLAVGWFLVVALVLEACMAVKAQNNDYVGDAIEFNTSGWIEDAEEHTWDFASADGKTFVVSVDADVTGVISVGMRWRCTQGTVQYAIVTAVGEYSGGYTQVTLYAGTDYAIVDAAIEDVGYSGQKAPFGFPLDPDKWSVITTDNTDVTQGSPVVDTWYNVTSITVPIGIWNIDYFIYLVESTSGAQYSQMLRATLSTGSSSESNASYTNAFAFGTVNQLFSFNLSLQKNNIVLNNTTKKTYYLNMATGGTIASLRSGGTYLPTVIRAVCAYL